MRRTYRFDDIEWHVPVSKGTDPEKAAAAGEAGARRKFLAQGDGGFYAQVVEIPAGFAAPTHSHDHAEIFMVLEGGCDFDGVTMGPNDMTVVEADQPYAFVAGADGVRFLVVRRGEAGYAERQP